MHVTRNYTPTTDEYTAMVPITTCNMSPYTPEQTYAIPPSDSPYITNYNIKPLVILDVNGVLADRVRYRPEHYADPNFSLYKEWTEKGLTDTVVSSGLKVNPLLKEFNQSTVGTHATATIVGTPVIPKANLAELLDALFTKFTVAIWSSAKSETLQQLVELLIPEGMREKLLFVWSQTECNAAPSKKKSDASKVLYLKNLTKVYHHFPFWSPSSTVLVDDTLEKLVNNDKSNCILGGGDDVVGIIESLREWVEGGGVDVREFLKGSEGRGLERDENEIDLDEAEGDGESAAKKIKT
jgi:hypothetical protein